MYLILLGAPGAGKGTQAEFLSRKLGIAHIASGNLFRQEVAKGTSLGLLAKSYMERGALVPDEVTIKMILERLNSKNCSLGCLLDGFPRTLAQAQALDKALAGMSKVVDKVIYIKVSEEELLRRISGRWLCRNCETPYHSITSPPKTTGKCDECGGELYQRPDDTEDTVKGRLKVYFAQTLPLLDYYQAQGKLIEVDGEAGVETVTENILKALAMNKPNDKRVLSNYCVS